MGTQGQSLHDLARQYLPMESIEKLIPVVRCRFLSVLFVYLFILIAHIAPLPH